jgi:hypothetical protein
VSTKLPDYFIPDESPDYFIADQEQGVSRGKSLINAPVKGLIKGARDFAALNPFGNTGFTPEEGVNRILEQILPTQEKGAEKFLERAGRLAPAAIGGPETLLAKGARTAIGAWLGQLAEEAGAPEWVQNLSELAAFMAPKLAKGLTAKKSQVEAVNFLREKGLTDREITPLIQSEKKLRTLGKVAQKGAKTEKVLKDVGQKLGESYEAVKEGYKSLKQPYLRASKAVKFDDALQSSLEKINPRFTRLIEKDLESLRNNGVSGESLINFYQDINATVKGQEGGKAVLGILKKPILEGLKELDPRLEKDFTKLNQFYSKKAQISKALKPGMIDKFISKGKAYATIAALATMNPFALKGLAAEKTISLLSRELLINPRLQNLSNQMLKSISQNKTTHAIKLLKSFKHELNKSNKEIDLDFIPEE